MSQTSALPIGRFVEPSVVSTHFHIRPNDTVADFGAGSGYFLSALHDAVGDTGVVYACEIQKQLIERIGDMARSSGLSSVKPVWGDLEAAGGIAIPDQSVDVGILINTLFVLADKETALAEIKRTLRPGALLYVIDWSESFQGLGPSPAMVITEQATIDLLEMNGFTLETTYPSGDHHYGLAFRKA